MTFLISRPVRCAFIAAVAASACMAFADPVIVNGSFELPAYDPGTINSGGGDGWTKSFMGPVSIISGQIRDGRGRNGTGVDPGSLSIDNVAIAVRSGAEDGAPASSSFEPAAE